MSPEAVRLLKFATKYPAGWHSFAVNNPRKTRRGLLQLEELGLIEIARWPRPAQDQFRLKLGEGYEAIYTKGTKEDDNAG